MTGRDRSVGRPERPIQERRGRMAVTKGPDLERALAEVEGAVRAEPRQVPEGFLEGYVGGGQSRLRYAGLKMPQVRELSRRTFSFSSLPVETQFAVWDHVWHHAPTFETLSLALIWLDRSDNRPRLEGWWEHLQGWSARIDNWAHGDELCGCYARLLEQGPGRVYPVLRKWNASPDPWLRRLSLVSLLHYARGRKRVLPFDRLIAQVEPQVGFEHHYVQRAVGWTLREMGACHPEPTLAWLRENVARLSAIAFSAATEKLDPAEKAALKARRKAARGIRRPAGASRPGRTG